MTSDDGNDIPQLVAWQDAQEQLAAIEREAESLRERFVEAAEHEAATLRALRPDHVRKQERAGDLDELVVDEIERAIATVEATARSAKENLAFLSVEALRGLRQTSRLVEAGPFALPLATLRLPRSLLELLVLLEAFQRLELADLRERAVRDASLIEALFGSDNTIEVTELGSKTSGADAPWIAEHDQAWLNTLDLSQVPSERQQTTRTMLVQLLGAMTRCLRDAGESAQKRGTDWQVILASQSLTERQVFPHMTPSQKPSVSRTSGLLKNATGGTLDYPALRSLARPEAERRAREMLQERARGGGRRRDQPTA